ncbi:MAG: magnesium transporter [Betaproteobacteria bacterium]|nr:MAG: magnesium transporter [Betaproteobacteria bacterium]
MAESWHLSVAFLENHTAEAARVLEALPTAEASALLETVPERLGARVLGAMLPTAAARLLNAADEESARALLHDANTQTAVAILRHLPESARVRLISGLSPASALASQMLLGFPDDTVGAWTDPEVVTVSPNETVDAAITRVRAAPSSDPVQLYVVDAERRLLGSVTIHALLRAPTAGSLVQLMQPVAATLSVMMPLASARDLTMWERSLVLPVVDHDKRLLGVLRRSAVTQALRMRARPAIADAGAASVAGALAASYWGVVSTLAGATTALLPPVKRVLPDE